MRITIHLPDKFGEEIKLLAKSEGVSLSKFIAKGLERYLIQMQKKRHIDKVLDLVGKVIVSDNPHKIIEEGRLDNRF